MADPRKLRRAQLIARLREIDYREAALAASTQEAARIRLSEVAERTHTLAAHYARGGDPADAQDLRRGLAMRAQLRQLADMADGQARRAGEQADGALAGLATADRRRRHAQEKQVETASALAAARERLRG